MTCVVQGSWVRWSEVSQWVTSRSSAWRLPWFIVLSGQKEC